tara:strand:- start:1174 stop:1413 length:240 start_codon:yes stop_codon:yes gene_type:complete
MNLDYEVNHDRPAEELEDVVYSQSTQLQKMRTVRCACGEWKTITHFFKCLYCEECFCKKCAEDHFGLTKQEWKNNKNKI